MLLLLAACGTAKTDRQLLANVEAEQRASADEAGQIECAAKGSADFARACTIERTSGADGIVLTVRNPDGAFHRLLVTTDGRGVVAADGAEQADVTVLDANQIQVAIGGDRYRLPATVKRKATS